MRCRSVNFKGNIAHYKTSIVICKFSISHCLDLDLNHQKTRKALLLTMILYSKNKFKNREKRKKNREQFLRAALTGHGQSSQSANFWKIAKMTLFNPCMKFEFFWTKWLHLNWQTLFIKCLWLCPSAYSSKQNWINGIISKIAHRHFWSFRSRSRQCDMIRDGKSLPPISGMIGCRKSITYFRLYRIVRAVTIISAEPSFRSLTIPGDKCILLFG